MDEEEIEETVRALKVYKPVVERIFERLYRDYVELSKKDYEKKKQRNQPAQRPIPHRGEMLVRYRGKVIKFESVGVSEEGAYVLSINLDLKTTPEKVRERLGRKGLEPLAVEVIQREYKAFGETKREMFVRVSFPLEYILTAEDTRKPIEEVKPELEEAVRRTTKKYIGCLVELK